eukprot:4669077-Alexandrium_andersonii.AAC.1
MADPRATEKKGLRQSDVLGMPHLWSRRWPRCQLRERRKPSARLPGASTRSLRVLAKSNT